MQKHWDNPAQNTMPAQTRVPATLTIGNVHIAPATVLAPMAGVTDTVFRRFIKNASKFTPEAANRISPKRPPTSSPAAASS